MISRKYKFYFICIPKTGCTSVISALENFSMKKRGRSKKHFTNLEYKTKEKVDNYFSFAFVRNPFDRMVSQFHFTGKKWFERYEELSNHEPTFTNYVKHLVGEGRSFSRHRYKSKRLGDPPFGCDKDWSMMQFTEGGVDFIGRFENLQKDFDVVCDKIGVPRTKLSHTNKTRHKHYTEYYDDETRQIVMEKYKKDLDHFGYEFGA